MPNWYWEERDLRNTPSRWKGLDTGTEARYRREGVRYRKNWRLDVANHF